eukprot:scaffold4893_cov135-Isochrysis_galbana.AAC.1
MLNSGGYIGARGMLVGWTGRPMRWVSERSSLWVLPAVEGAIKGDDRTLTLHRRVTHLKLRRRLGDGAGGVDLWIGKLRVEAHWAAMDNSRGSGKAIGINGPQPLGAHA